MNPELGERGGVGHYTYFLVKELIGIDTKNTYVLYFDWRVKDTREFERSNVVIKHFPFSQYNRFLPFAYSHMLISAYLMKEGLDVFHSPVMQLPLTYPKKSVITVHDLGIYKNPEWYPSQIISSKLLMPRSLKSADRIIAVSESTKKDLQNIFNVPARKITVTHEGVVVDTFPVKNKRIDSIEKFKLNGKFLLFVGTLVPRKNILTLLRAYKNMLTQSPTLAAYPLVVAGAKDYKNEQIFSTIKELKLAKQVRYVGYVTHNQKVELMKRATCFVFPSLYEGFGAPVLEAMACGTPVVTSNVSSLPEVAGRAAVLVNPEDEAALSRAMRKVLTDVPLQTRLKQLGRRQAEKFTWRSCAEQTIKAYHSLHKK